MIDHEIFMWSIFFLPIISRKKLLSTMGALVTEQFWDILDWSDFYKEK